MASEYTICQQRGATLQRLLQSSNLPSTIPRCTLTTANLKHLGWNVKTRSTKLPEEIRSIDPSLVGSRTYIHTTANKDFNEYSGGFAPGVIIMENLWNKPGDNGPYIAQIAQALYTHKFSLSDLHRVFVLTILQEETRAVTKEIYKIPAPGVVTLIYGTRDFRAVLGSKIGRTVAYLVLGAFARGTAKINKICLWQLEGNENAIQMQFDIKRF